MKRTFGRTLEVGVLLLAIVAYCRPAHAYVDMGTGSYILQISIAAVAGVLFSAKVFWASLRDRVRAIIARTKDGKPVSSGSDAR